MFLNILIGSISTQYHVVYDDVFSTVVSGTPAYPEVGIRLSTSSNSIIQVMLDQEYASELDYKWLADDEQ